jgi:hypothetical protein
LYFSEDAVQQSDTCLAILDERQVKYATKALMLVGEERCGLPPEGVKKQIENITDLERLDRMLRRVAKATTWDEILEEPYKPTIYMSDGTRRVLEVLSQQTGKNIREILRNAVEEYARKIFVDDLDREYLALERDGEACAEELFRRRRFERTS